MKTLKALEIRIKLNEDLKKKSFDEIFGDIKRIGELADFLLHDVGKKWLKTENGLNFKTWNDS